MKQRLDQYILNEGYTDSRQKAQGLIMSGVVFVNNQKADKAGFTVKEGDVVEVRGSTLKYVSRGGLKLEKAILEYNLDLEDKVCMDIGASTGGFSDCMLQSGAKKVFCVDVGYGQLAWKLRTDERIINLEKTNIRNVTLDTLGEKIDFFSVDVSFISLKHIFPVAFNVSNENVYGVCLIKPQFEAGRENVGKNGVVRDSKVHFDVINKIINLANEAGFFIKELTFSPIKGPKGNIEFLILVTKNEEDQIINIEDVQNVVNEAKTFLGE